MGLSWVVQPFLSHVSNVGRSSSCWHKPYLIVVYYSSYIAVLLLYMIFLCFLNIMFAFWQKLILTISFVSLQMGNLNTCSSEVLGAYFVIQLESANCHLHFLWWRYLGWWIFPPNAVVWFWMWYSRKKKIVRWSFINDFSRWLLSWAAIRFRDCLL